MPQRFLDRYPLSTIAPPDAPPADLDDIPPAGRAIALSLNADDCITRQGLWTSAGPDYALAGRSLRPLLDVPDRARDFAVLTTLRPHDHAIPTDRWRCNRDAHGEQELYDAQADPGEFRNLAGDPALAGVMVELGALMPS